MYRPSHLFSFVSENWKPHLSVSLMSLFGFLIGATFTEVYCLVETCDFKIWRQWFKKKKKSVLFHQVSFPPPKNSFWQHVLLIKPSKGTLKALFLWSFKCLWICRKLLHQLGVLKCHWHNFRIIFMLIIALPKTSKLIYFAKVDDFGRKRLKWVLTLTENYTKTALLC